MKRESNTAIEDLEKEIKDQGAEEKKEEQPAPEQQNETVQKKEQLPPITNKKRRIVIIAGYNGVNFSGSQKNKDVRTAEGELEKTLHNLRLIHDYNFGDLQKISFNRATRTDKRVHALQNVFSCKIQFDDYKQEYMDCYEPLRKKINENLPDDVKVFCIAPVANRFDSKLSTSHREYSYFLPSFCLAPIKELNLESPPKPLNENQIDTEAAEVVTQIKPGIKKILRKATVEDEVEDQDNFLNRDVSHIDADTIKKMYMYRLSDEQKAQLSSDWKGFEGTHKYHNYTRDVKAHEMAAQRYMTVMEVSYRYVNVDTNEESTADDATALEFVHFYLKGQSFLYNQIRKMVGVVIQKHHGMLGEDFIPNTHKDNVMQTVLAPGDGLMLEMVGYDKYNELSTTKEPVMLRLVSQKKEVDKFREELLCFIAQRESQQKAFSTCMDTSIYKYGQGYQ